MTRIRSEFEADVEKGDLPSEYRTSKDQFEIPCSVCGRIFYFDRELALDVVHTAAESDENPFTCTDCEADYEDLAAGSR